MLHTCNPKLQLHPHVHCVVPAGGLSLDRTRWIKSRYAFFLSVKVLRRVFRGKFVAALKHAFRDGQLSFHGDLTPLARSPEDLLLLAPATVPTRLGGLFQTTLRRPRVCAPLSRPLQIIELQNLTLVMEGLRIAKVFRNKEGQIVTYAHRFDPSSFRAIEEALMDLYASAFHEQLTVRFSFTPKDGDVPELRPLHRRTDDLHQRLRKVEGAHEKWLG